jgi:ATP-dependent helicase/nuclease subunit A
VGHYVKTELEAMLSVVRRVTTFSVGRLHGKLVPQWDHFAQLEKRLAAMVSEGGAAPRLDELIPLLATPRMQGGKGGLLAARRGFSRRRARRRKTSWTSSPRDWRPFFPARSSRISSRGRRTIGFFLNTLGLQWHRDLFDEHLRLRRLTFAHLERLALRILCTPDCGLTEVAKAYQRTFRHVLVDEFQDVNELQNLLLRSVARPATDVQGGNLFAVGDVKQSIYEFRQADPTLFLKMYRQAVEMTGAVSAPVDSRVNLRENFRSHGALLEEFNKVFGLLLRKGTIGLEYNAGHAFAAGRKEDKARGRAPLFSVEILPKVPANVAGAWQDELSPEALRVAELVAEIGPPWSDVCILLRSTVGTAPDLIEALRRRNIPVFCDSRVGFLTAVEVIEFQSILKAINNPYDDVALLGTLRGPAARWNEEQLLALREVDRDGYFIDNLERVAAHAGHALSRAASEFAAQLVRWQEASTRMPMQQLFTLLFDDLHLVEQASVRPGGDQRRLNLLHLHEQAKQFDSFLRTGLGQFLTFLDDLIANDEDFSPPSPLPPNANVVRIMSVHKSKGMQFPVVVVPFLGKQFNETNLRQPFLHDRRVGVATRFRDEASEAEEHPALYQIVRFARQKHERAEELRLLYVALTRAQEAVHLLGTVENPLDAAETHLRGDVTHDPEAMTLIEARRPLEWIYPYIARRFTIPQPVNEVIEVRDGIASLRCANVLALSEAVPAAAQGEAVPVPELLRDYDAAWQRIEKLLDRRPLPAIRAKVSVTEAKRAYDAARDAETPPLRPPRWKAAAKTIQWLPESLAEAGKDAGLTKGTATHRFLALCDLVAVARGERKLKKELERLTEEGFFTAEEAGLITLEDIAWFLNSELGKRLRQLMGRGLAREKAFTVRVDGDELATAQAGDLVILQGVVDVLFREATGWILIDYKTDFCGANGERIPSLVESYTPQLQLYRLLVERTFGQAVAETWLVFLQGRQSMLIPASDLKSIRWEAVVEAGAVIYPEASRKAPKLRGV